MGWAVLYIAFGFVALWLLGEVLLQYKARLRWRLVAFCGFLGVVAGVVMPSVPLIAVGAVAFATGQTFVTLSFRRGFSTGWALGGRPGTSRRRRAERGAMQPLEPLPEGREQPGGAADAPPPPGHPPVDGVPAAAEGDYPTGRIDPFAAEAAQRGEGGEGGQGEEIYGNAPPDGAPEPGDSYRDPYQELYGGTEGGGFERSYAGSHTGPEAGGEGYGYGSYAEGQEGRPEAAPYAAPYAGQYSEQPAGPYADPYADRYADPYADQYADQYADHGSGMYRPDVPPEHQSYPGGYGTGPDSGPQTGGYPQDSGSGEWPAAVPSYQETPPGGVWMPQQRDPSPAPVPGEPGYGYPGQDQDPYAQQEGYDPQGQGYYYNNDQRY
ncbi:hypothetical protein [Streptomyces hoynatensis]|uniref:hypothetical protein n=1 Tax=Streptomyces hoynatensis TaxID=1141874 RepID=UPI001F4D78AD|nr:hypothetical protein [Streptomyces hoynatensis]